MKPQLDETFQLQFRHLVILLVFFSILLGLFLPLAREFGSHGVLNPPLILLVAAPWLLGMLVLLFERASPMKFWAAPLLVALAAPGLAVCHYLLVVHSWFRHQSLPNLLTSLGINTLLIGVFTLYFTKMLPRRCPECRRLAMIPLRRFWGPEARTPTTRWCACCGAKYWLTSEGELRKERRRTWLDPSLAPVIPDVTGDVHQRFNADARGFHLRVCNSVPRDKAASTLLDAPANETLIEKID